MISWNNLKSLEVFLYDNPIGELVILPNKQIAFEYNGDFIKNGFSISPFYLPLKKGIQVAELNPFNGLHGVFSDSLPDGWGNLLVDRFLRSKGINSLSLNMLERLSLLNNNSMGALSYKPSHNFEEILNKNYSFDDIAKECKTLLDNKDITNIDNIFHQGGSNGGARPKIYYQDKDNKEYLVKFQSKEDTPDIGAIEYVYYQMAISAGINMPKAQLLESNSCAGYFMVERFDREDTGKIHMHSLAGLANVDFRLPSLDYKDIMAITMELTKDMLEVKKVFQLAVFNICSNNKDDHAKNFAFLYKNSNWQLSPAFDLTYSTGLNSEHNTTLMGKGKNITFKDIYSLGREYNLEDNFIKETIEKISSALSNWQKLAKTYNVSKVNIQQINKSLLLKTNKSIGISR